MTLVCHHPELAGNPGKYISTVPSWRENGVRITPAFGTPFTYETAQDFTHTTLNINITVDHFRNESLNYSCLLVVVENGQPIGVESSGQITVDPVGEWVVCMNGCIRSYCIN